MKKLRKFFILIIFFLILPFSLAWADTIIDNTDPGFQLIGSGYWDTRHNPPWPCYGNDIRFNMAGNGEDQAIYTFEIPTSGYYDVYAWWASHDVCSQDTPYIISFSDGTVTVRVNQQENPGKWNLLATGFFEEGEHQVTISDDASGTIIVADAIRIGDLLLPNNAPILDPIGSKTIDELELLEFAITASDPDNDDLTYSASNLPEGATFDPESHVFSWIPDYDQTDNYTVLFTVADNGDPILSDSEEVTITVGDVNRPPILNPIGNRTVNEEDLLEFTVTASDPDNDDLTYAAENLPDGASFDPETQIFSWTPDWQSSGEHKDIIFSVSDAVDYDEELITIDVIDKPPLLAPAGLAAVQNGNEVILNWEFSSQAELAGYNIYRSTSNPGHYLKLNDMPVVNAQYIDNEVEPGMTYYYFVTAVDIFDQIEVLATGLSFPFDIAFNDEGQLFSCSWIDGVVWSIDYDGSWSIYASGLGTACNLVFHNEDLFITDWSGGFVNRVTPDGHVSIYAEGFDHPSGIDFSQNGETFVAEDWGGRILKSSDDGATWDLFIEGLDGPGSIKFDNLGNLYVAEDLWVGDDFVGAIDIIYPDGTMDVLANLTDPDGICFDKSSNLYVGQSDINQISKVMPDGNSMPVIQNVTPWGCDINKFGELIVALPWDGQIIKVHLNHESDISNIVNMTIPYSNHAPILDPLDNMSVDEGQLLEFTVTASDPDGDNLTYSASSLPAGTNFNPATQEFSWTPNSEQIGIYAVVFIVTDDGDPPLEDSEVVTINVIGLNDPPVADDQLVSTFEDTPVGIVLTGSDVDNDPLTYTIVMGPVNGTLSGTAPNLTYTPNADFNGSDTFTFRVNDGQSDSNTATVTITVTPQNDPPIASDDSYSVEEEGTLTIVAPGILDNDSDVDGDTLTAALVTGPTHGTSTLNADGSFTYEPEANFTGTDSFTYTANDGSTTSNEATVSITVTESNDPPVLTSIGNMQANEGETLSFTVSANDPNGDGLSYSSSNLPEGAAFDPVTREFSWTPEYGQAGIYANVVFTVTDDGAPPLSDSEQIEIVVQNGPLPVDIIIDNTDQGFQLIGSGYWHTRNNPPWPSYGNNFRFNESGYGEDQAVYTFNIPTSGYYEVYAWWLSHSICSQNTPYLIPFSDGTVIIRVNQQENPGQWNRLATGFFEEGEHQIIISDDASSTMVVADAIRIVSVQ